MERTVMSKKKSKAVTKGVLPQKKPLLISLGLVIAVFLIAVICLFVHFSEKRAPNVAAYKEKLALLEASALTKETEDVIGKSPAGGKAGNAVFLSICDTTERASVFCGTGPDLRSAWEDADTKVVDFLTDSYYDPAWVKADVVYTSKVVDMEELREAMEASYSGYFRYGIAFDTRYQTSLLEAELNSNRIYDYDEDDHGELNLKYLNRYLNKAGRESLEELPKAFALFQCLGWFCDENNVVWPLHDSGVEYGRRVVEHIDSDYINQLLDNTADFLAHQVNPDGSFIYGIKPRFDNEISGYNILRHAGTVWAMICQYGVSGDETLREPIQRAIDYMLDCVVYQDENTAYIYEEESGEIKLGGCGICILALTEYMEVFRDQSYLDVCEKLGHGIVSMMNEETGGYYHVFNRDFSLKEENRVVFYDGEATFALCRLYGVTGNDYWLDAAQKAVGHFIAEDYTQYEDHWVAYAMNEITKYVSDPAYYEFGLRNVAENLKTIQKRTVPSPTSLEMLMATFELYDRALESGIAVEDFDLEAFLHTISVRVNRQLNGYFYPEFTMYMERPNRVLNSFMVRHDGYRVQIDDVQHNIGGYYLYVQDYDKLVSYGLLDNRERNNG